MEFPLKHASTLFYLIKMVRDPQYLIGSPQHQIVEYQIPNLNISLLIEKSRYYFFQSNNWSVFCDMSTDYKQQYSFFNNYVLQKADHINITWGWNIVAEYSGNLDDILSDIRFLWFQNCN